METSASNMLTGEFVDFFSSLYEVKTTSSECVSQIRLVTYGESMFVQTIVKAAITQTGLKKKKKRPNICTFFWSSTVDASKRGQAVGSLGLGWRVLVDNDVRGRAAVSGKKRERSSKWLSLMWRVKATLSGLVVFFLRVRVQNRTSLSWLVTKAA